MQREVREPKNKSKFVNIYDVIMVQKHLLHSVTNYIGQPCFKSKKYSFEIDTESPNLRETILAANSLANLVCEPHQMHVQVRFGSTLQLKSELYENFEDVLNKATNFLPGGLFNIQVARMQTEDGLALPIYIDFGTANDVIVQPEPPRESIINWRECLESI